VPARGRSMDGWRRQPAVAPRREPAGAARRTPAPAVLAMALLALLASAGCSGGPAKAGATPSPSRWPAAVAGGACHLFEYEVVEQIIGVSFDVSAAVQQAGGYSCVLQKKDRSYPDLTLAVSPTTADVNVFRSTVVPKNSTVVSDLGRLGYSAALPAAGGAGPAVEVGWLAGNSRLLTLRYRFEVGVDPGTVPALVPKLVQLAQRIDLSSA